MSLFRDALAPMLRQRRCCGSVALALASSCVALLAPACGSPQVPAPSASCAAAERQERGAEESLLCVPHVMVISLARREDKW